MSRSCEELMLKFASLLEGEVPEGFIQEPGTADNPLELDIRVEEFENIINTIGADKIEEFMAYLESRKESK